MRRLRTTLAEIKARLDRAETCGHPVVREVLQKLAERQIATLPASEQKKLRKTRNTQMG
jgi:hypothetical protein